jgi:MSHA biogenesis protein MshP
MHQQSLCDGLSGANRYVKHSAQAGSSLVMALFIIVLMSVLLLALGRQLISSSTAVSIEVQGNRAFNAAQSGLQLGLTQLFPLNATDTATCAAVATNFAFNQPGLQNCTAAIVCLQVANPDVAERPLFRLTSTGNCPADEFNSSRVVVMEAY